MKHGKKIAWILTGAILSAGCITGCSKEPADAPSNTYHKVNLSMAVNGTDTQIDSLVANHFAQLVNERSEGNVTIDVFPNDTLAGGNSTKGVEYIATGGSDLGSYQDARETIDSTGGAYYAKLLEPKGITYLGSFHNGFRQLTNSKRAVTKPEDLKGLKIRVPGSAVYMNVFDALGANPTAMSWSEVFTAIQQGTIDGQENGCSITKSAKMDEIQAYMTIWNYSYENDLFIANTKIWNSLDESTQELLRECAVEACNWGRDHLESEEEQLIEGFREAGMQVDVLTEEQLAPFQEAITDVIADLQKVYGEEACAAFGME